MRKKSEKPPKEKPVTPVEEEGPKSAEDYVCTGNLEHDFTELCARMELVEAPIVTLRHQAVIPSGLFDEMESLTASDVSSAPPMKDQISFFRPSVQMELENDDPKSVKAVYIRGWMIDQRYIFILQKCLPALSLLHTVNLWNVGLTETTFTAFIAVLRQCINLKSVVLDGNPIPRQPYHLLLSEDSLFQHVTLRNNKIDDAGAKLIGEALSTTKKCNRNLLTLNLSYNHITDVGAAHIADGLRLNRTLLWLTLAYNQIGDRGAIKIAEVLSPFALTHQEVVERRLLLLDSHERQRSPISSRRPESKSDRSSSHLGSGTNLDKLEKSAKSGRNTSKKKDKVEKGLKEQPILDRPIASVTQMLLKKEEARMGKRGSIASDLRISKTKVTRSGKDKRNIGQEHEFVEFLHPLVEFAEHRAGQIQLSGNICLLSLNLTHNRITETGLKSLLMMVRTQIQNAKLSHDGRSTGGLLRLAVAKNIFPPACETYTQLHDLMLTRDPVTKHRVVCSPMPSHSDPPPQS
ncbi:leucine-rich repeat-containing protein 71 isoform X2 [Heterodontus francisci]|uniref:leucine-rich repeat-containing protein 71 isoform X2 n=1 Tax=Heterodontus francisci TaxID=7792 RepID=UPI00355C6EA2